MRAANPVTTESWITDLLNTIFEHAIWRLTGSRQGQWHGGVPETFRNGVSRTGRDSGGRAKKHRGVYEYNYDHGVRSSITRQLILLR